MTEIIHAMADRSDDNAVEAVTRVLAIQTGLIRAGTEADMDAAIRRLPAEARHGFRELALQYVTLVRDADRRWPDSGMVLEPSKIEVVSK